MHTHLALKPVDRGIMSYFAIFGGFQFSAVNLCLRLPPLREGEMPPIQEEIENTAEFLVRLVRRVQVRLPHTFFHGKLEIFLILRAGFLSHLTHSTY